MRRLLFITLIIFFSNQLISQELPVGTLKRYNIYNINPDSIDKQNLIKKLNVIKLLNDSLNELLQTDSLYQLYKRVGRISSKDYSSWYLSAGPSWSDLGALNDGLKANSLPELSESRVDISYIVAFFWKRNRFIHDLNMQFTVGNARKQDSLRINYNIQDLISYKFGYSIINSKRLELSPYIGINFRLSEINFENSSITEIPDSLSSFASFTSLAINRFDNQRTELNRFTIPLDYGVELNYHLKYSKWGNGITIGTRFGQTLPFITAPWKNNGTELKDLPEIKLRQSYLSFILRFYWRRNDVDPPYPYSTIFE